MFQARVLVCLNASSVVPFLTNAGRGLDPLAAGGGRHRGRGVAPQKPADQGWPSTSISGGLEQNQDLP
jgi:hypothetical protein